VLRPLSEKEVEWSGMSDFSKTGGHAKPVPKNMADEDLGAGEAAIFPALGRPVY
jgi:hypothetical protein